MRSEGEPQTYIEANTETVGDMLANMGAFSALDLSVLLEQFEIGEGDEI